MLLAVSLSLCCDHAEGQVACKEGETGCVILTDGTAAPFSGMLLNVKRAANLTVKAELCQERVDLAVAAEREQGEIRLQAEKNRRSSDRSAFEDKLAAVHLVLDTYKERFSPRWYQAPELWFLLGVGTAALVTAGSVAIIDKTRPEVVTVP